MWEMFDESNFEVECDNECGAGPPPTFNLPPPPRPDFMQDLTTCSENSQSDYEMCEAIPILDASSLDPSLQSSAMILLCSVLMLIFIFISSILVWKHKRKVQNFLPCKTPTRGPLDPNQLPGGQSLTYEDPDVHHHIGHHRPLVIRPHPLNMEMLHAKTLHYPSGIPLQRSPPLFSSPGPDPYRSHDNVYEELEHRNGVGINNGSGNVLRTNQLLNCDRDLHSDEEDFAEDDEDDCSLPGDRSFNKSSSDNTTVATIYQEHSGAGGSGSNSGNENSAMYRERNRAERNSLLSSASSSALESAAVAAMVTRPNLRNSSSSNESSNLYHHTLNNQGGVSNGNGSGGGGASFFRFRTARPNRSKSSKTKTDNFSMYNINSATNVARAGDVGSEMMSKDNSGNGGPSLVTSNSDSMSSNPFNGNHIEIGDTNNNSGRNGNFATTNDGINDEVERLNRRNAQLSNPSSVLSVATIFRDRNHYHNNPMRANANYYAPPQHIMMSKRTNNNINVNNNNSEQRARTNPRTDRRRYNNATSTRESAANNNMQEYLYHEPVYHDNLVYDPYMTTSPSSTYDNDSQNQIYHHPYMMPEFTSSFRNYNNLNNPHQPLYNTATAAAMGSDSGYSQNTQNSGRSLWSRRKRNGNNSSSNNNSHFLPTASTDDLGNS